MIDDAQIKQWKKYRRQSVQHLGVTPFLVIGLVILLGLIQLFVPLPAWVMVIVLAVPSLTILGDCINVAWINHKFRKAGLWQEVQPPPNRVILAIQMPRFLKRFFIAMSIVLFVTHVASYLVLSRRGMAEARAWNSHLFCYIPPEPTKRWQRLNRACVVVYSPLNRIDRALGTGMEPVLNMSWGFQEIE